MQTASEQRRLDEATPGAFRESKRIDALHRRRFEAMGIQIGTRLRSIRGTLRTVVEFLHDEESGLVSGIKTRIDSPDSASDKLEFTIREVSLGLRTRKFEILRDEPQYVGGQDD